MSRFSHITKEKIEDAISQHDIMTSDERRKYGAEGKIYAILYSTNLYPVKRIVVIADNFFKFKNGYNDFNATEARNYLEKIGIKVVKIDNVKSNLNDSGYFNDEIINAQNYYEGAKTQITINKYERDPKARNACLNEFGYSCMVCGFSFGKVYGEEFRYKIHVHHLVPLSEIKKNYVVNPITDLVPVCPNCHMVIHSKVDGEVYSIEEVKQMLNR